MKMSLESICDQLIYVFRAKESSIVLVFYGGGKGGGPWVV